MNFKKIMAGALPFLGAMVLATTVQASTEVVTPDDMKGWGFLQETTIGSGMMVNGPVTPPMGVGSANLVVDSSGGVIIRKAAYNGLLLSDIENLSYSTYRSFGGNALAIALQFNFDGDLTDFNESWQGRLVYEPYHTQSVTTGTWQTWNAIDDAAGSGTGNWWFSNSTHANNSGCKMATPCTWAEVKSAFPNGGVHNTLGAVILKAGGGWTGGFDGNVDALTVNDDTYDFEPFVRSAEITSPTAGDEFYGLVSFDAMLIDDDMDDSVNWAVRKGTCAAGQGTVFGNVDGYSNSFSWNGETFHAEADASTWESGMYCFVFNPTESDGDDPIRLEREFYVTKVTPTLVDECKKGGWENWLLHSFKNQGDCVSWLKSSPMAIGNKKNN